MISLFKAHRLANDLSMKSIALVSMSIFLFLIHLPIEASEKPDPVETSSENSPISESTNEDLEAQKDSSFDKLVLAGLGISLGLLPTASMSLLLGNYLAHADYPFSYSDYPIGLGVSGLAMLGGSIYIYNHKILLEIVEKLNKAQGAQLFYQTWRYSFYFGALLFGGASAYVACSVGLRMLAGSL